MAYEVTKLISGRPYRYRVDRVRDEATGRMRSRWTYLGRGGDPAAPRAPRPRTTDSAARILDALERLLETAEFADLTADAIAREAGLAHGTFYRHFRDKRHALRAAMERLRAARAPLLDRLEDDVATRDEARANISAFARTLLRAPSRHTALLRAWYAVSARDHAVAVEKRERAAAAAQRLRDHVTVLCRRGFATATDPAGTGAVVFALLEGYFREGLIAGVPTAPERVDAAVEAVDRAIFGRV